MKIIKTNFKDLLVIKPTIFKDERGHFYESFKKTALDEALGYFSNEFVQDNESFSIQKVFRGFHFQKPPHEQAKLVRVSSGIVRDIVIDLRKDQDTFKQIFQIDLSEENKEMLYVPRGFAHGFVVLSDKAVFQYKCDNYYNKESESGISPLSVEIDWPFDLSEMIIHQRDKDHLRVDQF